MPSEKEVGRPRRTGPWTPNGSEEPPRRPQHASAAPPHDSTAERDLITRVIPPLRDPDAVTAVITADPSLFYVPTHARIATALRAAVARDPDYSRATLVEELARIFDYPTDVNVARASTPAEAWQDVIRTLIGDGYAGLDSTTATLNTLERYRRQRRMMALAADLAAYAQGSTEWHERVAEIAELANTNGAVDTPDTLEVINLDRILRGEAPDVEPFWLRRNDGRALLYPGRIHDVHAEPSVGKTWIALAATAEVIAAGGNTLYLDYEDTGNTIVGRLIALGVPRADLYEDAGRFRYINPAGALGPFELAALERIQAELIPDLVVVDGVAEALARDGLDENSNTDVTSWAERVIRPMARRGAAVLLNDHVTKNPEHRTRGARGASAKLAIIDGASFDVRLAKSFSRAKAGVLRLVIAKDRPGGVGAIGEIAAELRIVPKDDGDTITIHVEAPVTTEAGEPFRPTGLMDRLSAALDRTDGEILPLDDVLDLVDARKKKSKSDALKVLVAEGFVDEVTDPNTKARRYRHARRYREEDDPKRSHATPTPAPADPEGPPVLTLVPPPADYTQDELGAHDPDEVF